MPDWAVMANLKYTHSCLTYISKLSTQCQVPSAAKII